MSRRSGRARQRGRTMGRRRAERFAVTALLLVGAGPAATQEPAVGREAALALPVEPLEFRAPRPEAHEILGVPVLFLSDPSLPLVTVRAHLDGGYAHFERSRFSSGLALSSLLRTGGTRELPPDSVDRLLEHYALAMSFASGGKGSSASVNTLSEHLGLALDLWGAMLTRPGFDPDELEVWRGREMEMIRRRGDDPTRLAFESFNRLSYGDHPVGWRMELGDLEPDRLSRSRLEWLHARVYCRDNLVLGMTGDVTWAQAGPLLRSLVERFPPCPEPLPEAPAPAVLREGGIYLVPRDLEQSTVVMAHGTPIVQGDTPDYFASRIADQILGGAGFGSRLLSRLRTERGYAYHASSLWTTPSEGEGLVGALTQTRAGTTVSSIRLMLEVMDELVRRPPSREEVDRVVRRIANGFVFNFEAADQIVGRRVLYRAQGLPDDWLQRYLEGTQAVGPEEVHRVVADHLHPERMVILVVGDPSLEEELRALGDVRVWDPELEPPPSGGAGAGGESPR